MRRWLVVLVACQSKPAPPQDPPPPPPARDAAAPDAKPAVGFHDANHPPPPALAGVALRVATATCDKPTLDECKIPDLAPLAQAVAVPLPACTLADRVELREIDQYSKRGLLVLRRANTLFTIDLLTIAAIWDPVATKYNPRLHLDHATCESGIVDVAIAVKGADVLHVQCRDEHTCVRETKLAAGGPKLAAFLAQVKRATEAHDWTALLALCSAGHKRSQITEMHQDRNTYLAEILGLHAVGNSLNDDQITLADLNTLGAITFIEIEKHDTNFSVIGTIARKTGEPLRLELTIAPEGAQLRLTGGVG